MTPISPGALLAGRFRLEDLLEETGGARFWRATDITLMRDVAVHVIDAADPRSPALLSAARSSATLTGPHLLRVLDAAVEDDVAYVVAEWGNGVSLDRMLLEGPLQPRQAAWMVREVADAIADAHRHGIAHGRLIPENVLVNENGSVKLIGFVVDAVLHGRHEGKLSDHESDVRNLAALLYSALVGKWPGTPGTTLAEAPRDHGRVMRARQVRAGVPTALDRICDSVLNGEVTGYPIESAHEIKAAVADFLGEGGDGMPLGRHASGDVTDATEQIRLPIHDPEATQASMPEYVEDDATQVQPLQPSTKTPYVGMGGGKAPVTWGPDVRRQPDIVEPEEWEGDPPGTSWLRLAGLVAAALALLFVVIFAFNLGRGGGDPEEDATPGPGSNSPAAEALPLASVEDFDPFGDDQEEHPDEVALAHDRDPSTAWTTNTYFDGPDMLIKPGVGLLVDLGSEEPVSDVELTLVGSPTTVQLMAAPSGSGVPTDIDNLVSVTTGEATSTELTLTPDDDLSTRYLVIWLTSLPAEGDDFRGGVAEIVVRS